MPSASTVFTFLPTTSRSRSRRTTSTSGSSGIARTSRRGRLVRTLDQVVEHSTGRDTGNDVGDGFRGDAVGLGAQTFPGDPGGRLLRRLLRAALTAPVHGATQQHVREEPLRVVGALVAELVARELLGDLGRERLETGLVVLATGPGGLLANAALQGPEHQPGHRLEPAVQVHRRDDRLRRVGQDRRLRPTARGVLPLAEAQRRAEVEL